MTDSRMELIQQIQTQKHEMLEGFKDSKLKQFIREHIKHFSPASELSGLYQLIKNPGASIQTIKAERNWQGFGIYTVTQKQMLDLLYKPTDAVVFRHFRELIAENGGTATALYVLGKRAVLITNKSDYNNIGDYRIGKEMGGSVPDIFIVPWYAVTDTNIIVTEV